VKGRRAKKGVPIAVLGQEVRDCCSGKVEQLTQGLTRQRRDVVSLRLARQACVRGLVCVALLAPKDFLSFPCKSCTRKLTTFCRIASHGQSRHAVRRRAGLGFLWGERG